MPDYYSPIVPILDNRKSVKAWCHTAFTVTGVTDQTSCDAVNFIDGYNLKLDVGTFQAQGTIPAVTSATDTRNRAYGAIKFQFLTPMPNNKYMVFVTPDYFSTSDITAINTSTNFRQVTAHVLNSAQYPKTTDSFYVRFAVRLLGTDSYFFPATNLSGSSVRGRAFLNQRASENYRLRVVVL